jgi:hypothetical protein
MTTTKKLEQLARKVDDVRISWNGDDTYTMRLMLEAPIDWNQKTMEVLRPQSLRCVHQSTENTIEKLVDEAYDYMSNVRLPW